MAVKHRFCRRFWWLDHPQFVAQWAATDASHFKDLFDLQTPFYMDAQAEKVAAGGGNPPVGKKRKSNGSPAADSFTMAIEADFQLIMDSSEWRFDPLPQPDVIRKNNQHVRQLTAQLLSQCPDLKGWTCAGTNPSADQCQRVTVRSEDFLIPPRASYIMDDLANFAARLSGPYDVVLLDPPWPNKHVKRVKARGGQLGYPLVDLKALETHLSFVPQVLSSSGVVLIWTTNSKRQQDCLQAWLHKWGLQVRSTWVWIKVTRSGQPVTSWNHAHKVPFERLWVASFAHCSLAEDLCARQIMVSVPSAIQSTKPPLADMLAALGLINDASRCLEVFGRYLLPGWTTVGNEALKFQHDIFYHRQSAAPN